MNPLLFYFALSFAAAVFARAPGNNPDSDDTYPAWVAWRILPAVIGLAVAYTMPAENVVMNGLAAFGVSALVTDVARKVLGKR